MFIKYSAKLATPCYMCSCARHRWLDVDQHLTQGCWTARGSQSVHRLEWAYQIFALGSSLENRVSQWATATQVEKLWYKERKWEAIVAMYTCKPKLWGSRSFEWAEQDGPLGEKDEEEIQSERERERDEHEKSEHGYALCLSRFWRCSCSTVVHRNSYKPHGLRTQEGLCSLQTEKPNLEIRWAKSNSLLDKISPLQNRLGKCWCTKRKRKMT